MIFLQTTLTLLIWSGGSHREFLLDHYIGQQGGSLLANSIEGWKDGSYSCLGISEAVGHSWYGDSEFSCQKTFPACKLGLGEGVNMQVLCAVGQMDSFLASHTCSASWQERTWLALSELEFNFEI